MFLTINEMKQLTGYVMPAKQVNWLKQNGIKFMTNRYGHPLVLNRQIEIALIGAKEKTRRVEPDEAALKRAIGLKD